MSRDDIYLKGKGEASTCPKSPSGLEDKQLGGEGKLLSKGGY